MSNKQTVWPDVVFASLLMLAGLLMLRYGVWHLVHHHEVVSPLLAGGGALILGALSIRQVLRSRRPPGHRCRRKLPAGRTRWWFWAIVVSASANGFASAHVAGGTVGVEEPSVITRSAYALSESKSGFGSRKPKLLHRGERIRSAAAPSGTQQEKTAGSRE
jgi:hypothetical protein